MEKIVLLGATGSIGLQTLEVLRKNPGHFKLWGISSYGKNMTALEQILFEFQPSLLHIFSEDSAEKFRKRFPHLTVLSGIAGFQHISSAPEVVTVLNALPGAVGLSSS